MFTPPSPHALNGADRALATLQTLDAHNQLEAMGWGTVAVLGALRERFERTAEEWAAYDLLCSETLAWFRREIEALRFTKAH